MGDKIATRQSYGKALVELGGQRDDIIVLDADLSGSTMTKQFAGVYPERFFNVGIAEANLYGMAAGLAISGKTVFASTFAMFAAGRAFEIIRNSIGYTGANVKICATHAGLTVGEDGASHQAIEDLALMCTIPGMRVLNPADDVSARALIGQAADFDGPVYIRLGRADVPVIYDEGREFSIGRAETLRQGDDYALIATGTMVGVALEAADALEAEGISVRVIDMHTLKPLDEDIVVRAARETKGLITVEEHTLINGLGAAVAQVASAQSPVRVASIGIEDTFGESGKPDELLEKYGLTPDAILQAVRTMEADEHS